MGGCCSNEVEEVEKEKFEGPIKNRHCRDVIFLLLFIAFWVGMIWIAALSWKNGEPLRLVYGADSWGNICGLNNEVRINSTNSGLDLTNRTYLYYTNPTDDSAYKICVSKCPASFSLSTGYSNCTSSNCTSFDVCISTAPYSLDGGSTADQLNGGCPDLVYETTTIPGLRYCVLSSSYTNVLAGYLKSIYAGINSMTLFQDVVSDFTIAWKVLIYCVLIGIGMALVLIILMRCFAAPLVYLTIIAAQGSTIALTYFLGKEWKSKKDDYDASDPQLSSDRRNVNFFLGFFITSLVFTILLFLLLVALRNRIRLAVSVFEEASKAIGRMPQLYLQPIYMYFFLIGFFFYWVVVYLFLATSGTPVADSQTGHVVYVTTKSYQYMWWYHLFGLLWTSQFILACGQIVLAGAIAQWYFTRNKSEVSSPLTRSICRLIGNHLGSAAFGSLIIAIIQLARIILAYIQRKLKGKTNKIVDFILCCLQCCLWCFEKFMKFINKNAYIEIAIYGYSFCTAARQAFKLLFENILRVFVINSIAAFAIFVCKLGVTGGAGIVAYYWLKSAYDLHYGAIVIFFVCVFTFIASDVFFDVYKMSIDTIFLCFAEDSSRNDGSTEKPYFMSENLLKFMKSNAKNKPEEKKPEEKKQEK